MKCNKYRAQCVLKYSINKQAQKSLLIIIYLCNLINHISTQLSLFVFNKALKIVKSLLHSILHILIHILVHLLEYSPELR